MWELIGTVFITIVVTRVFVYFFSPGRDGEIIVTKDIFDGHTVLSLELNGDPNNIENKRRLVFKVVKRNEFAK